MSQLKGSGARSNGSGEALAEPSCPLRPSENKRCAPAGAGQRPAAFSRHGPKTRESYGGSAPKPPGKIKRFKPFLLSAFREQQEGKGKRKAWGLFAPKPPARNNVPGPDQLAHRTPNTTQAGDTPTARKHPGQLQRFKPFLLSAFHEQQEGKGKRKAWGLFAPKPPTRNNVPGPDQFGAAHTRHRTAWAMTPNQTNMAAFLLSFNTGG